MSNNKIKCVKQLSPDEKREFLQRLINEKMRKSNSFPLSFSQSRLYLLNKIDPGNTAYNLCRAIRLKGNINIAALKKSVNEIFFRQESLRTTCSIIGDNPVQTIGTVEKDKLEIIELSDLPKSERNEMAKTIVAEEAKRSYDLYNGPLVYTKLLKLEEEHHVFVLSMHHFVSDCWSMGIFFKELSVLYESNCSSKDIHLKELPLQYIDYAVWQRELFNKKELEDQLNYWKQKLDGMTLFKIPTDYTRPEVQTYRGAFQTLSLSKELYKTLKSLCQQEGATLFMISLAIFKVLLYRLTGQGDIGIGFPIANRNREESINLIGFFVNNLVIRTNVSDDLSFLELLRCVRKNTLEAYNNQDLPFEKLLEELNPGCDMTTNPLFSIFFNIINLQTNPIIIDFYDLDVEPFSRLDEPNAKYDFTLHIREQTEEIELLLNYNKDLFDAKSMFNMLEQYRYLLKRILENPAASILSYSLTPTGEKLFSSDFTTVLSSKDQKERRGKRVEDALKRHSDIEECVVVPFNENEDKKMIAYVVYKESVSSLSLRRYLRRILNEEMIPSRFIQLDKIPYNRNGEIDYDFLYDLADDGKIGKLEYVPPQTPLEKQIAKIWGDVLNVNKVGLYDNFLNMGGHSILVFKVINRIKDLLQISVTFEEFTKQNLKQFVDGCSKKMFENEV